MKIAIISSTDISGGAAIAAYRLHKAFLKCKINSNIVVLKKKSKDFKVTGAETIFQKILSLFFPIIEKLITDILYRSKKGMFSTGMIGSSKVIDQINLLKPDIVHLHWINGGMIKIEDLKKINSPLVWSLQDMWPFTGGCHFSNNCDRYQKTCGSCKVLSSKNKKDISNFIHKKKNKSYHEIKKLVINGPSKWIASCAKKSPLFKGREITNIPNTINTNVFKPFSKKLSRKFFNLPENKRIILFSASNIYDPRKGFKDLLSVLSKLNYSDLIIVIAGESEPVNPIKIKFPTYYIPPVFGDISLSKIYNLANVVVVPSKEENLSNTILESMACGVPVVAFDIGGNSDMIDHKINGYLAKPKDKLDILNGIKWSLNNKNYFLAKNARKKILKNFSHVKVVNKFIKLYKSII